MRELAELEAYLAAVAAGHGGLVLLAGEAGIGKTWVLDQLAARAARRGVGTCWARCWEERGAPPYWPWTQVLRAQRRAAAAAVPALERPAPSGLAVLLPELSSGTGGRGVAGEPESEHARFRLFDAVASWFRAAAEAAPLLVLIDDLHAADLPSLGLLAFLARELRETPVLMVGAYRDADVSRVPAVSAAIAQAAREGVAVTLSGLQAADVARFVAVRAGVEPSADVVASLHRQTGGNPLFLDELVRLLDAGGRFDFRATGRPQLPGALPHRVQEAVEHRVAGLSPDCRRVLDVAAVIGLESAPGALAAVTRLSPAEVLADLAEAVANGIVTLEYETAARVRFRHAMFRDAHLRALTPARRAALHADVARVLQSDPETALAEVAHHLLEAAEEGGDVARAVDGARRAAAEATARVAHDDAAALYERALSVLVLSEHADRLLQGEILVELGETRRRIGDAEEAGACFERALTLVDGAGPAGRIVARAALGLAGAGPRVGRVDPLVVRLLEDALRAVGPADGTLRARLLARLGAELAYARNDPRAGELTRDAVAMAERLGDLPTLGSALVSRHAVLLGPSHAAERSALASRIIELGRGTGGRELEAEGLGWRLLARLELGDVAGADADLEALAQLAAAIRHPRHLWLAIVFRAMRALLAARIDDAERLMQEALGLGQRHGDPNAVIAYGSQLFMVRRAQGRLGEIAQLMHEVMGDHAPDPTWGSGMALLHAMLGQLEQARARFVPAYETFVGLAEDDTWLLHLCVLGETCAALGDRERARVLLARLRPFLDRFVVAPPGAVCQGAAARVAGLLAATLECWEESLDHLEAAARANERAGALPWLAETAANQAAVLAARDAPGDREAARGHLARARALATRLGLRDVAAQVERIGARLDDGRAAAPPGRPSQVFRREGEHWRIEFAGRACRLRDSKGVRLLAELLRHPGEPCHAAALVAAVEGTGAPPDPATLSAAESERHRVSVTRTVRGVIARLARSHRDLGEHLSRTVRTGTWCTYDPDPRLSTAWDL